MDLTFKDIARKFTELKCCVIVPVFNNAGSVVHVVESVLRYTSNLIVVNDGSTDGTDRLLESAGLPVEVVSYRQNRGKGYALKVGFERAVALGYEYAITMDADGQHLASDLPAFAAAIEQNRGALIIGSRSFNNENMPGKNGFANRFSNFWFTVQTGYNLPDTQTGFRAYPLGKMRSGWILSYRYEAELELLVFAAWGGIRLLPVDINVYYPPKEERVTHFRPAKDFARISLLNTFLTLSALFYGWPVTLYRKLFKREKFFKRRGGE